MLEPYFIHQSILSVLPPKAGILEMFLALTFRPGDSHCIHVDPKADETTTKAIKAVIKCYNHKFPNATVFQVPHPVSVFWGHISVLEVSLPRNPSSSVTRDPL